MYEVIILVILAGGIWASGFLEAIIIPLSKSINTYDLILGLGGFGIGADNALLHRKTVATINETIDLAMYLLLNIIVDYITNHLLSILVLAFLISLPKKYTANA